MSKFFEDIGKDSKDTLERGFPSQGSFRFNVETKTPNGISLNVKNSRLQKRKGDKVVDEVSTVVEHKYDWKKQNVELTGSASTSNRYEVGLNIKDRVRAGSKGGFTLTNDLEKGSSVDGNLSFKNEAVAFKSKLAYPFTPSSPIVFDASGTFFTNNIHVGMGVKHSFAYAKTESDHESASQEYSGVLGYDKSGYQASVTAKNVPTGKREHPRNTFLSFDWFHKFSSDVTYGVNFSVDTNQTKGPVAAVGGSYILDEFTTLKGKTQVSQADGEFRVGLGAQQKLSPHVTVTLGADLNARKILGNTHLGNDHSFGFEVKLS